MMDVFIAVVFKRAICGFTESGVFCFFSSPPKHFDLEVSQFGQNLQPMLFMSEAWTCLWLKSHSYIKERNVSILLTCALSLG